jgi:hypothetical protein
MSYIVPGMGNTRGSVADLVDYTSKTQLTLAITDANVGGVGIVTATWASTFECVMGGVHHQVAAGSVNLNSADVAAPTTYYVYFEDVSGVPTAAASTTNPSINPLVAGYFITNVVRFSSVAAAVVYYAVKYPSQDGIYELVHNLKENVLYSTPQWLSGVVLSLTAGGKISTTTGYVRFVGNEPRVQAALTEATIALEDETTTVAGLDSILTYSDTSAITADKYVKLLVGIKRNKEGIIDAPLMVCRSAVPTVEYATEAVAYEDQYKTAATSFPPGYEGAIMPLAYITVQKGDYTKGTVYDLRTSGIVLGAAAAAASDHSTLANLGADDHPQYYNAARHTKAVHDALAIDHGSFTGLADDDHTQYLLAGGTRALSANWDAGSFEVRAETFESDVATGTAPFTVASATVVTNLNADTVDGLEGASFLQADGSVQLTGNLTVKAATTIDGIDISAHAADTEAHHATVTLSVDAGTILGLSTQEITLDSQTATYALMGPTSGGAVAPTFRKILDADIAPATATMTLTNGSNDNVLGTNYARVYLISGPTATFTIGGITGGLDGRVIYIVNRTGQNMTIEYEEGSSTDVNRILTNTNADTTSTGNNSAILVYIAGTTNRWVVVSWNT